MEARLSGRTAAKHSFEVTAPNNERLATLGQACLLGHGGALPKERLELRTAGRMVMPRCDETGLAHFVDVGIQSILMPDLRSTSRFAFCLPYLLTYLPYLTSIKVMRHQGLNKELLSLAVSCIVICPNAVSPCQIKP